MGTLKDYVNAGDFENSLFIDALNSALGGGPNDISNRTQVFFDALKTFGLIEEDTADDNDTTVTKNYCGIDYEDASSKCSILCGDPFSDSSCPEGEICHKNIVSCIATVTESSGGSSSSSDELNIVSLTDDQSINTSDTETSNVILNSTDGDETSNAKVEMAAMVSVPVTTATTASVSNNYCGSTWVSAATQCKSACPSGMDIECPPGQYCFAEISSCATNKDSETSSRKWCGKDWSDASIGCLKACPAGLDSECPPPTRCFGDVVSC